MCISFRHANSQILSFDDMVDKHGLTPLHWAIFYDHSEHLKLLSTKYSNRSFMGVLVEKNFFLRSRNLLKLDSKGRTYMTYTIRKNSNKCIEVYNIAIN